MLDPTICETWTIPIKQIGDALKIHSLAKSRTQSTVGMPIRPYITLREKVSPGSSKVKSTGEIVSRALTHFIIWQRQYEHSDWLMGSHGLSLVRYVKASV